MTDDTDTFRPGARRHGVLRATVRGQRRDVVGSAPLAVGHQLSEAAVPVVVGVVLDRAVGTGDGSALALWLAVVVGVFVVLASCGAIGYWLMDRPGCAPGAMSAYAAARVLDLLGGRRGGPANRSAWPAPTPTGAARSSPPTPGWPVRWPRWSPGAVLFSASPMLALAVLIGVPVVLGGVPAAGWPWREQRIWPVRPPGTDLVTGRVLEASAAAAARQPDRLAGPADRSTAGASSVTTALTGLLLVVVAWMAGRLALAGTISIGELVAAVGLAQFLFEPLEALTRLGPLVAGGLRRRRAGGDVSRRTAGGHAW